MVRLPPIEPDDKPVLTTVEPVMGADISIEQFRREAWAIAQAKEEADRLNAASIERQSSDKTLDIIQTNIKDEAMNQVFEHWRTTLAAVITVICFALPLFGVDAHTVQVIQTIAVSLGLVSAADGNQSK